MPNDHVKLPVSTSNDREHQSDIMPNNHERQPANMPNNHERQPANMPNNHEHQPAGATTVPLTINVNGKDHSLLIEPNLTLKQVLQFHLGLIGAKEMCDRGACGSCTVIMDGKPTLSCNILAAECGGKTVETVEGIAAIPKWKPLIDAYCKWDAMQCGYCTPGFLVAAKALLDKNPTPTEREINEALSGNICICGTYPRHSQAILEAVRKMAEEGDI